MTAFGSELAMQNGPQVQIRPSRESDAASLCDAVKAVAAEKWHLATVDGFSLEQTREFLSQEGLKVRGRKLEDRYQDVKLMALWL